MLKLTIDAGLVFDGEYELDLQVQPLTNWDLHIIKKISGVRAGELEEALAAGDADVLVALATIALQRVDKVTKRQQLATADTLFDAEAGKILAENVEEDAGPPAVAPESESPTGSATGSSSPSSKNDSDDHQEITPTPTGPPQSDIGPAGFGQAISRT